MEDITSNLWTHWHAHPDALIGLALLEGIFLLGVGPVRARFRLANESNPRQIAIFTGGVLVIFLALQSPIHDLSNNYLFSAHMFQHVMLTLIAPPLLIAGTPEWLIRPLLRPRRVLQLMRLVTHPIVAFSAFNIVFSIWHIPALYNSSVMNNGLHILEHIIFITAATLMWWPLLSKISELPRLSHPQQIAYLFLLSIAQLILFAPITFSRDPLYDHYINAPQLFSFTTIVDQQIGGIIMKLSGGIIFITLIITTFFRWFNQEPSKSRNTISPEI